MVVLVFWPAENSIRSWRTSCRCAAAGRTGTMKRRAATRNPRIGFSFSQADRRLEWPTARSLLRHKEGKTRAQGIRAEADHPLARVRTTSIPACSQCERGKNFRQDVGLVEAHSSFEY